MADELDYSFKKLVGREYTTTLKRWYEEQPGFVVFLHRSSVWTDDIPAVPPVSTTSVVRVYDTLTLVRDTSVSNYKSWRAEDPVGTRLYGFIPPRFGQGYNVQLFDATDREIPPTDGSSWMFDYDNGTLTFDNDPASVYGWNASSMKIKSYLYIGSVIGGASVWKSPVPTFEDLPIDGNIVGDIRPVADNGVGKWEMYRCISLSGTREEQWQVLEGKLTDIDCGSF
jgi:hypothetical protein